MDIYIDRPVELGRQLPPGAPDFSIDLGTQAFHIVDPAHPQVSQPVRLKAGVYCGVTDVLYLVAQPINDAGQATLVATGLDDEPADLWVRLDELLLAPLNELPCATFDPERLPAMSWDEARARGLRWQADANGEPEVSIDPNAPPRRVTGMRREADAVRLRVAPTGSARPGSQVMVSIDELTPEARQAALALMDQRQAALAEIDALHALQPALRAMSRARRAHREPAPPDTVQAAIQRHRALADQELRELLLSLRRAA